MNLNATILSQTIAFILFVIFCMKYVWQPLMAAIEKRQKEIADSLRSVEEAKKYLSTTQINAINQLKKAKAEAQMIIEEANKRYEQILDEARIKAKKHYMKVLEQAQTQIAVERKNAHEELCKQVSALIVALTEKVIEHSINELIDIDIINKFITDYHERKISI